MEENLSKAQPGHATNKKEGGRGTPGGGPPTLETLDKCLTKKEHSKK